VINHRGEIVLVVDLALWLGIKRVQAGSPTVLVTEFNMVKTAFLVSGVTRIHRASWADIKPMGNYLEGISEVVTGAIILENRIVLMLDLERILGELDCHLTEEKIDAPARSGAKMDAPSSKGPLGASAGKIKVLHADDSGMVRRTTKKLLEDTNEFSVTSFVDGLEAWNYLEKLSASAKEQNIPASELIDIILLDIEMPGQDGYSLCLKIKNNPVFHGIPVILFSSLITDKPFHKGKSVGADDQLAKPSPDDVLRTLRGWASKKREHQAQ
jgi:two-component system chemotaxis response regulator CheV